MAKKLISKKKTLVSSLDLTGTLNLDELEGFNMEFEDEGTRSVDELIRELNGQYVTISIKVKEENLLEENEPLFDLVGETVSE